MRSTLALFVLLALASSPAEAGVRSFFSPQHEGGRVDSCLSGGACGKPAADAFCKAQGYDHALIFQRETHTETRVLDSGAICTGSQCTAFRQVKCYSIKEDFAAARG